MNSLVEIINARLARALTTQWMYSCELLDRPDALEVLSGPLTPGDETTRYDDSGLLDLPVEDVYTALQTKVDKEKSS